MLRWGLIGGGAFVALSLLSAVFSGSSSGLHVGNLRTSGFNSDIIHGEISNDGDTTDVWIWIEVNQKIYCPRKTFVQKNTSRRFEIRCYSLPLPPYEYQVRASASPPVAIRQSATTL